MTAYVIARISVVDPDKLKTYQQVAPTIIEKFGGSLLARGGEIVNLEGPEDGRRIVIMEFPSLEQAKSFYHSDEYSEARALREEAADFEIVAVKGLT